MHRLAHKHNPSATTSAALLATVAAAAFVATFSSVQSDDGCKTTTAMAAILVDKDPRRLETARFYNYNNSSNNSIRESTLLASSPTSINRSSQSIVTKSKSSTLEKEKLVKQGGDIVHCDYAIVGHGKAGQSAVRTIKQLEPNAEIVIIDPHVRPYISNNNSQQHQHPNSNAQDRRSYNILNRTTTVVTTAAIDGGRMHHYYLPTRARHIDHTNKCIHVHPIALHPTTNDVNDNVVSTVHYRKSALLATGSRGAPPPNNCIRPDAYSRILELRSTSIPPQLSSLPTTAAATATKATTKAIKNNSSSKSNLPILDPTTVRMVSSLAISQGATVAVMGSGYEALELVAHLVRINQHSSCSSNDDTEKVKLIFGNAGPMSKTLPRYLSTAISKRLRQNGIMIEERAMTQYVSMDRPMISSDNDDDANLSPSQLELFTIKTYDTMDTKRILTDLLVLAPSVDGLYGTAVIPTVSSSSNNGNNATSSSSSSSSHGTTMDHLPWSSLISPPIVTCYLDDGRIVTNSEFHAASSLYAAGSVAKYPNTRTGQAEVAGGRHVNARLVGEIAAMNMVKSSNGSGIADMTASAAVASPFYLQGTIPVWRSDIVPYISDSENNHDEANETAVTTANKQSTNSANKTFALYSMGIHALCVGRCDSESMATHGFWWTNTNQSFIETRSSENDNVVGPNAFMKRATRNMNRKRTALSNPNGGRGSLPVYGSGVVYYVDRSGNIEGIMLWGLPITSNPSDVQSNLNTELVNRMKHMILSNGGIAIQDHSENITHENSGLNMDVTLLSYLHLAEESKFLASMALTGTQEMDLVESLKHQTNKLGVRGRPLHRYTPIKPPGLTNLGKVRRTDETGVLTEENDIFYPSMTSSIPETTIQRVEELARPPSLKRIDPMQIWMNLANPEDLEVQNEAGRRKLQIERSRPPKEEPLWARHGEENRTVNMKSALADNFLRNMYAGRFSDGKEAVQRAPVPKLYLEAKDRLKSWITGSEHELSEDEDREEEEV